MSTALFNDIIFGPIRSRRLGISLGVNLLPTSAKLCNFECIYCECGWSSLKERSQALDCHPERARFLRDDGSHPNSPLRFNSRADVKALLGEKLREMAAKSESPDVITFAGNGEPTLHPDFEAIIDDTIELRDEICQKTKISVLSNATMIGRESVRRALSRVDNNILKLDSAFDRTVRLIDNPPAGYSVAQTVENMKLFTPRPIIQTMFLRGEIDDRLLPSALADGMSVNASHFSGFSPIGRIVVDNTTDIKKMALTFDEQEKPILLPSALALDEQEKPILLPSALALNEQEKPILLPSALADGMSVNASHFSGFSPIGRIVVDNTTDTEVSAWLALLQDIEPQSVMIYTIDRDTPLPTLEKIPLPELNAIAKRVRALGISVSVSG